MSDARPNLLRLVPLGMTTMKRLAGQGPIAATWISQSESASMPIPGILPPISRLTKPCSRLHRRMARSAVRIDRVGLGLDDLVEEVVPVLLEESKQLGPLDQPHDRLLSRRWIQQ